MYANNYDLIALPVDSDPFLKELDLFIRKSDEDTKENFVDIHDEIH